MNTFPPQRARAYGSTTLQGDARAHLGDVNNQYKIENAYFGFGPANGPDLLLSQEKKDLPTIQAHGITVVWNPDEGEEVIADLCFVHGPGGHPLRTWQYEKQSQGQRLGADLSDSLTRQPSKLSRLLTRARKSSATPLPRVDESLRLPNEKASRVAHLRSSSAPSVVSPDESATPSPSSSRPFYWPLDLISKDFPSIRVLSYGYEPDPGQFYETTLTGSNIDHLSRQLLGSLAQARNECQQRPLVFVAHSLGGMLVKNALIISRDLKENSQLFSAYKSCISTYFFATPHKEMTEVDWENVFDGLTAALSQKSANRFAVPHGFPDVEKLMFINRTFADLLRRLTTNEQKVYVHNFLEEKATTNLHRFNGKIIPDYSARVGLEAIETSAFIAKSHLQLCELNDVQRVETKAYLAFSSALKADLGVIMGAGGKVSDAAFDALLEDIDYDGRLNRRTVLANNIDASPQSFEWLWQSTFRTWLGSHDSMFWIRGKPASGKSTLTLFIDNSSETLQILQDVHSRTWVKIYHFFDFRAQDRLENNFEGAVRSLLIQLLESIPQFLAATTNLSQVLRSRNSSRPSAASHLSVEVCQNAIMEGLHQIESNVLILLDGLDEYSGQRTQLVKLIMDLGSIKGVKICLASRPMAPFPEVFGGLPSLQMDVVNLPGIYKHSFHKLETVFAMSRTLAGKDFGNIAYEIAERSQGVFLWAIFAIEIITIGMAEGQTFNSSVLRERLAKVPSELAEIYQQIVRRIPDEYRGTAALIMLLISGSCATLTPELLLSAISRLPPRFLHFSNAKKIATECKMGIRDWTETMLVSTGGLVAYSDGSVQAYCRPRYPCKVPQLIHRTVDTYLGTAGWQQLFGLDYRPSLAHEIWTEILVNELRSSRTRLDYLSKSPDVTIEMFHQALEYPLINVRRNFIDVSFAFDIPPDQSHHEPKQSVLNDQATLLAYTVCYIFTHAAKYELLSGNSATTMLGNTLSLVLAQTHFRVVDKDCQCFWTSQQNPKSAMEIVMAHNMLGCIQDYLEGRLEMEWEPPQASAIRFIDKPVGSKWSREECVLSYALNLAINSPGPGRLDALKLGLSYENKITDSSIFMAVALSTADVVDVLLSHKTNHKLTLDVENSLFPPKKSQDEPILAYLNHKDLLKSEYRQNIVTCQPLWALVRRRTSTIDDAMLDTLLLHGADLNEQCGPLGTVLHSLLDFAEGSSNRIGVLSMLEALIAKGVDVNSSGPVGNSLELAWKLANTCLHQDRYSDLIPTLIAAGAVNNCNDPNGKIPSRECMLRWRPHSSDFGSYYQASGLQLPWDGPQIYHIEAKRDCNLPGSKYLASGDVLEVIDEDRSGRYRCINNKRKWLSWVEPEYCGDKVNIP